jgi:eukaryotic-like serine/threonine-protein kinase
VAGAIASGELLKDRYRLERTLGRGGMAAVWLGHDEVLDRPVAVKVLSDTIASDPGFVARFRREARTAAALSHPNLIGVYDFSEEGERPYLVMQFVPGENLAARLERGEGIDCDQLARELLEALAHIHEAGILHRDVKPANIIIEPDGTTRLIDFGIALPRDATALTSTGLVLGTERYAAPEVMAGEPATERSDLYSAGVVLRSCEGRCSRALGAVVEWMTSREPGARPSSARQALARLERAEAVGEPTQAFELTAEQERHEPPPAAIAPPSRPAAPTYTRDGSHRGRLGAVAAILGLLAAALVAAVVVLGGGDGDGGDAAPRKQAAKSADGDRAQKDQSQASAGAQSQGAEEPRESGGATAATEEPAPEESAAPAAVPTSSEADPSRGAQLNEEAFALIQAEEYEAAVPLLEEAVSSFPEGSEDVNYAYALFNLGNALRLSGRPDEAIPILEQRLAIPNQTGTVEAELEAARAEAE